MRHLMKVKCYLLRGVLLAVLCAASAAGQHDFSDSVEPTFEAVERRLEQVQASETLEPAIKEELLEHYRQALESLRTAKAAREEVRDLDEAAQSAARRLTETAAALATEPQPPQVETEGLSLSGVTQQRIAAEQAADAARQEVAQLAQEAARRQAFLTEAPRLISETRRRIKEIKDQLDGDVPAASPELAVARKTALHARHEELEALLQKHEAQKRSYEARGELLRARRDLAQRRLSAAEQEAESWRQAEQRAHTREAALAAREASRALAEVPEELEPIAERNRELAQMRADGIASRIQQVNQRLADVGATLEQVEAGLESATQQVDAGLTKATGAFLRSQRSELPDLAAHRRNIKLRQEEIPTARLTRDQLAQERDRLADMDKAVQAALDRLEQHIPGPRRERLAPIVRRLLESRRQLVDRLVADYTTYVSKLSELQQKELRLLEKARELGDLIDRNILWFRSSASLSAKDAQRSLDAARWLLDADNWAGVLVTLATDARETPMPYALAAVVALGLLVTYRRMASSLQRSGELATRIETDSILHSLNGLVLTVLMSLALPLIVALIGWRLVTAARATEFATAVGTGLQCAAVVVVTVGFVRRLCRPDGLAERHFRWRSRPLQVVRRNLSWLLPLLLPLTFFVALYRAQSNDAWSDSLGRVCLIAALVGTAAFVARVLRFRGGILQEVLNRKPDGWLNRLRWFWYLPAIALPVALALGAWGGHYYTAVVLSVRLVITFWLALVVAIVYELLLRWLFVERRRLAVEQARRKREAEEAERRESDGETAGEQGPVITEQPELSLHSIGTQTQQLLHSLLWAGILAVLWIVWSDVLPALQKLQNTTLAEGVGITLGGAGLSLVVLVVTVLAAKNIPGLLEIAVLQHLPLESAVRFAITTVSRYLIVLIGIVFAFNALGIGWEKVQWLAAAVTVGLGFGLQEIFANFVSGLIILFERPLRVGDTVTVGDVTGTVSRIRIRATTIVDWDRKELVVPNKEFITGRLINWTLSDRILRVIVPVGIAYGSDTRLARDTLLRAAREHEHVLDEPEPNVLFRGFGDSALQLELRVFVPSVEVRLEVQHDLHMAVDAAFREAGIEISFPQRDVHIRSIRSALPLRDERGGGST